MADNEGYDIVQEGSEKVLKLDYSKKVRSPSIEDDPYTMSEIIDLLLKIPKVTKISFLQAQEYVYYSSQVEMLYEIVRVYDKFVNRENVLDFEKLGAGEDCSRFFAAWRELLRTLVIRGLKEDPIGAFVELQRRRREEEIKIRSPPPVPNYAVCARVLVNILDKIIADLEETALIKITKPYLAGFKIGDRELYRQLFRPLVRPYFMYTKLITAYPPGAEELDSYTLKGDSDILVLGLVDDVRPMYHITPPEFRMSEEMYSLLEEARQVMAEHRPKRSEFIDPERTREIFMDVEKGLITDLAKSKNLKLSYDEIENLAKILLRYTIGFGLIEVLLADDKIQDISVNAPAPMTPVTVIHADYGECITNIFVTQREVESWATKLRLISGRPLDEANPVLDTDLIVPGGKARVSAIQEPLSPKGLAFSFRRHRERPWTLPLFIDNKFVTPLAAGLMWFLIDGSRTMLLAGTRSSGKTSFLGSLMVQIMRSSRVISIEDSVAGDSRVLVVKNGRLVKTTVGKLIDNFISKYSAEDKLGREVVENFENIKILAFDNKGKQKLVRPKFFVRHKVNKDIYEVVTSTGRRIKVTGDHSLFTLGDKSVLKEIKTKDIKKGNYLAVPRRYNIKAKPIQEINLLNYLDELSGFYVQGPVVREYVNKNWALVKKYARKFKYSKSAPSAWKRESSLPCKILANLPKKLGKGDLVVKPRCGGKSLPIKIKLDTLFLTFIGLWIADGCYDKNSVIMSVSSKEEKSLVKKIAERFKIDVKLHSDSFSSVLNSAVLKRVMQKVLFLTGDAYTKKLPEWTFNLSEEQISSLLKGLFSGDGCVSDKEVILQLSSENLLYDVQTQLLRLGIVFRRSLTPRADKTYRGAISALKFLNVFKDKVRLLQDYKKDKLDILCAKKSSHDTSDVIPLSKTAKEELKYLFNATRTRDYIRKGNNIGREQLNRLISADKNFSLNPITYLADSDIFWDKVISVKKLPDKDIFVYDISVPGYENFICENVIAHNTLELPVKKFKELGFDIQSMKVQSVITPARGEMSAEEGIRASLRLGDSSLIIGEVRSKEALALFEAMRVGALANVVAGTIHGASPYGVFDRVVNDLGVPRTSFKALDIVTVANPVKTVGGLKKAKRVTQISEIRKFWEEDPLREKGFADLMVYNPKTDKLEPTEALLNGESEVLKAIGASIKEWAGDWDAIWANIELRAKMLETIVEAARKLENKELLEAEFTVRCCDEFHKISELILEETGETDPKRVFSEWSHWFEKASKTWGNIEI